MSTDRDWSRWGEQDPYFAVLTQDKYRASNLDEAARREFFAEGAGHVEHVIGRIRRRFDADFAPRDALDFGCGVGRVLHPLTLLPGIRRVVGVDISTAMLEEARRNCADASASVELVHSDDLLSRVEGQFDLVHSCIVLQHIPPARGERLFARLIERVRPGGFGALHVLYGKAAYPERMGRESALRSWLVRALARLRSWRGALGRSLTDNEQSSPDPVMQMHAYDINVLLYLLQRAGIERVELEFTDHGGALGATVYFLMPATNSSKPAASEP